MKKILSALISAVIGVSAAGICPVYAAGETTDIDKIALFGDSIASGYGLDAESEYNYGQIIGDYLDCEISNYSVSGDTTFDLLEDVRNLSDAQKNFISESEVVVVSIGGNDMMRYFARALLNYAAENGFLNEGCTKDDVPQNLEDIDMAGAMTMVNMDAIMEYASTGTIAAMEFGVLISKIHSDLCSVSYDNYISRVMIPNITEAVEIIKSVNPDARIIIQSIYNPMQFSLDYMDEKFDDNKAVAIRVLKQNFERVLTDYRTKIGAINGVEVADVLNEFTSLPEGYDGNEMGYAYCFTDMQLSGDDRDFHPNQRGHLAIAAEVLDTIGILHDDNGLLREVYNDLAASDKETVYPAIAFETYKKVAGEYVESFVLGDVDGDGKVTGSDATMTLIEAVNLNSGREMSFTDEEMKAGDINGDGAIAAGDAQNILSYYTYVSGGGKLPMEEYLASFNL